MPPCPTMPPHPARRCAWFCGSGRRIGVTGFGGPPTHIRLLREPVRRAERLVDALRVRGRGGHVQPAARTVLHAAVHLLRLSRPRAPGERWSADSPSSCPDSSPSSSLAALFLAGSPPAMASRAPGPGAGAAVAAVAVQAGLVPAADELAAPHQHRPVHRSTSPSAPWPAPSSGPMSSSSCSACGVVELGAGVLLRRTGSGGCPPCCRCWAACPASPRTWLALSWVALKVGALSYGGGFVIVPLMREDAVGPLRLDVARAVPQCGRPGPGHPRAGRPHRRRRRLRRMPAWVAPFSRHLLAFAPVLRVRPRRRRATSRSSAPTSAPGPFSTEPARRPSEPSWGGGPARSQRRHGLAVRRAAGRPCPSPRTAPSGVLRAAAVGGLRSRRGSRRRPPPPVNAVRTGGRRAPRA